MIYFVCLSYGNAKNRIKNEKTIDAGKAREFRRLYKYACGGWVYKILDHFSRCDIFSEEVRISWTEIARNSLLFRECSHSVDCIMQELIGRKDIFVINIPKFSKKAIKIWERYSLKEASFVRSVYEKVRTYDKDYSGVAEERKIKRAVKFIRIGLMVYYFNKLPTSITVEEYAMLCDANKANSEKRYRYNPKTGEYIRVGGQDFKPAVRLFGPKGADVFFKKTINKFDDRFARIYK